MNPWDNYTPYNTWAMNRFGHNQWNSEAYNNIFRPSASSAYRGGYKVDRFGQEIEPNNEYYDEKDNPLGWRYADYGPQYSSRLFGNPFYEPSRSESYTTPQPLPSGRPQPGPGDSAFRWTSQTRGW